MEEVSPKDLVVIACAIFTGTAALYGTMFTAHISTKNNKRSALRELQSQKVMQIGRSIHETIALTFEAAKSTPVTRKQKFENARSAASNLKSQRLDVRYSLWGLDYGIKTLTRFPDWVAHVKDHPNHQAAYLTRGSELGKQLDEAIKTSYFTGDPPSAWRRFRIWFAAKRLNKARESFLRSRPNRVSPVSE